MEHDIKHLLTMNGVFGLDFAQYRSMYSNNIKNI